jgi:putative hydrolase of the HAD superfamily
VLKLYQYDKISHEELRYNRLRHSFDAINYSVSDAQIEIIAQEYIQLLPDNNLLLTVLLRSWIIENYKLHIITNGFAEVQGRKIKNAKLHDYFHTITNSDMAGVKKPNPIFFEYALDLAKAIKKTAS